MDTAKAQAVPTLGAEYLELLVTSITDYAIYFIDIGGIVSSWNAGAQRFKGYADTEIIGSHFSRFYTPEDRLAGLPQRALRIAETEGRFEGEGWRQRKDGTRFWAHVVIDPVHDRTGRLIGFAKITRDLTDRREAQLALEDSERRFRLLVEGVTDYAIYMLDPQGVISNWNAGAQRIKGYRREEIVGQHFSRFYSEEDRRKGLPDVTLATALREGRFESEGWRLRKDGSRFWASVVVDAIRDDDGTLVGFAKITRDITERRKAQEALEQAQNALFQSQKMEAVGQLTGGIAHDFNNLLTIIVNNLDLLSRHLESPREQRLIESAQRAADRGARLTQQLLAFSRRQPLQPEHHSANALISGFEPILRRACGETIHLETNLASHIKCIHVDGPQFESALLNLVVNARDATPDGGTVRIATSHRHLDERAARDLGLEEGTYVCVTVRDTGTGMSPDVISRAFEPFYTTKDVGKGTGLGLSQVYGFVNQSGGHVAIDSTPGEGTTVTLMLPAREGDAEPNAADGTEPAARESAGTVLIVEDEPDVLDVATEIFDSLGYDVLTATDAVMALEILKSGVSIDVLFSDVVMPRGMTGIELARETRRLRPEIKILLASGYPVSTLPTQGLPEGASFISKPYRWTELAEQLRMLRMSP